MILEQELRRALERNELSLFYQPKVSLHDLSLVGAEALIRWTHPTLGVIAPERFIHLAEENGMIIQVGDWVLERACMQLNEWNQTYAPFGPVSVNLAGAQLHQPRLVGRIRQLLKKYNLQPGYLQLEITENFIMNQTEEALDVLHQLKRLGVQLAIDDFGTGYANYERLKRLQADIIKIDGVFVKDIVTNTLDAMIVRSITDLAKAKSLSVVAEFVETQQQQALLHKLGVQYLQGYLIGRPQPLAD